MKGVSAELLDELLAPDDDPRLRPSQELVAREADEIGTRREAAGDRGLVTKLADGARSEIVDERQPGSLRDLDELAEGRLLGEADDPEVRLMDTQQERGLGADRAL